MRIQLPIILILIVTLGMGLQVSTGIASQQSGKISGRSYAVDVRGSHAYVGIGTRLAAIDVSNPSEPRLAGATHEMPDVVRDIKIVGDYAFVAAGKAGLRVVDISDAVRPVEAGAFFTSGTACGVSVVGELAYVADGPGGLHVIDISIPAAPAALGTAPTSEWDWNVSVAGNFAYVAADEGGLRVVDISNPAAPVEVNSLYTPGDARGVYAAGTHVYVAAGGAGLRVIDISNPAVPEEVGSYDSIYARNLYVSGGYVYLASERSGVSIIDVTRPIAPRLVADFQTAGSASAVYVAGNHAYIADSAGAGGLVALMFDRESWQEIRQIFLPVTGKALETFSSGN